MRFVLDASLAIACCFPDEKSPLSEAVAKTLPIVGAAVSPLWFYEVANILHTVMSAERFTKEEVDEFGDYFLRLPIVPVEQTVDEVIGDIRELADNHGLSAYDASYIHLCLRLGLPLGTLDGSGKRRGLKQTAQSVGVKVLTVSMVEGWLSTETP